MPGNTAWTQFQVQAGQVSTPTPVTITAALNSASASAQFTLQPPSLKSLTISPATISGGAQPQGIVMLNGQAPAGGAVVSLSSNSPIGEPARVGDGRARQLLRLVSDPDERRHGEHHRHRHGELQRRLVAGTGHADASAATLVVDA